MGLLSDLGLATARRLRARLGARGALRALMPMIASSEPSPSRAGAILVALECAIELDDPVALEELALWWSTESAAGGVREVARLVDGLIAGGHADRAAILADAEVVRTGSPAAHAVRAIEREASGEIAAAIADWRDAERGPALLAAQARVERLRLATARASGGVEAAREAASIDTAGLDARARLIVATARLGAAGRYTRVEALDALIELAGSGPPAVARAAIRAACAHLDRSGAAITAVERERIGSALARWPEPEVASRARASLEALGSTLEGDAPERIAALVRLAASHGRTRGAVERARAVLSGDAPGPRGGAGWAGLAAVAAIRRGRDDEARERLRELCEGDETGAPAWTACWMALARPSVREEALALARRLLASSAAPPRGFLHLAAALERAGAHAEARTALARAHHLREPDAAERRSAALVRAGWEAARAGRRDDAIELLRQARAIER